MTTRKKFDSVTGAVDLYRSATLKIKPPAHTKLLAGSEDFYNAVIDSRDASMWNDADLSRAVTLANYQMMIRDNTEMLVSEGEVVINERGTPIMNARFSVVNTLTRLEISLSKALQTDAASTQGESRAVSKRNKAGQDMKSVIADAEDDPLLARVQH